MLNFLGGDSGFGDNNTSAYIVNNNKFILIDCGFTVFNKVKNIISNYDDIDIIVTHLHNDHAGSLSQIIMYLYYVYNKKVRVISKCNRIIDYLDITDVPHDAYTLVNSTEYVELIPTIHGSNIDAYGIKLDIDKTRIIYTSDTSTFEPFKPYINDIDELYTELSATSNVHLKVDEMKDILDKISNKGVKIYIMHTDDKEYIRKTLNNKYEIM